MMALASKEWTPGPIFLTKLNYNGARGGVRQGWELSRRRKKTSRKFLPAWLQHDVTFHNIRSTSYKRKCIVK